VVECSRGRVRGAITHDPLTALSYTGSERSTRRAVAQPTKLRKLAHRLH
jgi:hypothetical protein